MAQYEITTQMLPLDFECTMANGLLERTIRNAKNLLMTRKGEIPFDRQRGLDQALFDMPFGDAQQAIMAELDRVMLWEPDVEVAAGWIERDESGETVVQCIVETTFED